MPEHLQTEVKAFQSTPSVWRETRIVTGLSNPVEYFNPLPPYGGRPYIDGSCIVTTIFQSTPSVWRETTSGIITTAARTFQSTPSVWRETSPETAMTVPCTFQSTPSVWRETRQAAEYCGREPISIHSLRMEGDLMQEAVTLTGLEFQSTPSVWRETPLQTTMTNFKAFQSTPSVWRETIPSNFALRAVVFQSTPSVWRETVLSEQFLFQCGISIHSLRMEGDSEYRNYAYIYGISIHSLRMEGDC